MQARVSCVLCFLFLGGAAAAQNPSPLQAARSAALEPLIDFANQRLKWEAAQTWTRPPAPSANTEPEHRPIHIDQSTPAAPKIRREWLQISPEAVTSNAPAPDQRRSSLVARSKR